MANISKIKRDKMLNFIEQLKEANKENDDNLKALNEIANALDEKRYGLLWEEHTEKVDEELENNIPVFVEDNDRIIRNSSINNYNFILEGDNLHSLYLLEKTHKGKVDVIYIDPPYFTGNNDFKYNDNFVSKDDDFRHSKYLSMMSKRLKIAKNILKKTGVIFISIDDNEFANMKLLCDEIFDEKNHISTMIWKSKSGGANDSIAIATDHEYILTYARNINSLKMFKDIGGKVTTSYNQEDEKGRYSLDRLDKQSLGYHESLDFPIVGPDGKEYVVIHKNLTFLSRTSKGTHSHENIFVCYNLSTRSCYTLQITWR